MNTNITPEALERALAAARKALSPDGEPVELPSRTYDALIAGFLALLEAQAPHRAPAAEVLEGWSPSDADVLAWRDRYDLDGTLTQSEARTAIDDARSLHMLAAATAPSGGIHG